MKIYTVQIAKDGLDSNFPNYNVYYVIASNYVEAVLPFEGYRIVSVSLIASKTGDNIFEQIDFNKSWENSQES